MLDINGLSVHYGDTRVLSDISLRIDQAQIVCVLGPSGSGKSTLLRTIAGLETPTTGTVSWDGSDMTKTPVHKRRFGLMFQDHALFAHRDVIGNVSFGLRMLGHSQDVVESRARTALDRVGLSGFEQRHVHELSGGEQQRVALARSIAPEPRLLMLDEPFGSLDRELRERLVGELHDVLRSVGIATLFVTHDQDEAFALADKVVLLRDGTVEQQGTPQEVWLHPETEAAAHFLGFSTFVDATVDNDVIKFPWGSQPFSGPRPTHPIRVAWRPDGLHFNPEGLIIGVVSASTFRRDHFLVSVTTIHGTMSIRSGEPLAAGTAVQITPDMGAALILPA
ncbi:MAG: ABC transporter ATP-binding protein [Acidimicrobiia bacterium]|nr:ABC transporter ATP-binding protein [Acidimicrobiia bacterium]